MDGPPPPPPPHGANPKTTGGSHASGGLPAGNYDIFIIPPHSSGSGFLYLPSLQVQRNSFIAGVASTLASIAVWKMAEPTVKQWFLLVSQSVSSGGNGVILLVAIVGITGWAFGKTQFDGSPFGGGGSGTGNGPQGGAGAGSSGAGYQQAPPNGGFPGAGGPPPQGTRGSWHGGQQQHHHQQHGAPPPPPPHDSESSWSGSQPDPNARAEWEKAREETRKREEEKKQQEEEKRRQEEEKRRQEEEKRRQEDEKKAKEEADRKARAKAEKEKWERMRAREREQREREARERLAKERAQKEKEAKEKEQREREAKEAEARAKLEKEIREKLEAEQKAKAAEEAAKKAAEEKARAEAEAVKAKAEAEAAAAKAKADAERSERLKAARERAQRDREARLKAEAEKLKAQAAASTAAAAAPEPVPGRRSTTYGGLGGGERLDPYAGARSPPAPSVTSTHSSPIKATVSPKKNYEKPSAKSYVGTEDAHSFRPYDNPKRPGKAPSTSTFSESSYAPSQSTARTTPPPSQRGPYATNDPDKIVIKAVYLFNDLFPKPVAQLVSGVGKVTDGLILKVQSEGLFIDDDVRNIPQREWDVKAWTLKLVETGQQSSKHLHILRACVRDTDGKKYVFILDESESWKLAIGLQRLRKGSQVRSLQNSQMVPSEVLRILNSVPPLPV